MNVAEQNQKHEKKVTPPKENSFRLPLVHIVRGNMKTFLNVTFHGETHKYLQDYLGEFFYRFNRRFWKAGLSLRLMNFSAPHVLLIG